MVGCLQIGRANKALGFSRGAIPLDGDPPRIVFTWSFSLSLRTFHYFVGWYEGAGCKSKPYLRCSNL